MKKRDSRQQREDWQGKSPGEIIEGWEADALDALRGKITDWTDRIGVGHSPDELQKRLEILLRLDSLLRDVKFIQGEPLEIIRKIDNAFAPPKQKASYVKAFKEIISQAEAKNESIEDHMETTLSDGCPNWLELNSIEMGVGFLRDSLHYYIGHLDGAGGVTLDNTLEKLIRRKKYREGPGAASREAGEWTMDVARKVLEKYGGYPGYKALPYGRREPVIDEIATAIRAKDKRNVYTIIKKIGAEHEGKN